MDAELAVDLAQVEFHRLRRQEQVGRDVAARRAALHGRGHPELLGRQRAVIGCPAAACPGRVQLGLGLLGPGAGTQLLECAQRLAETLAEGRVFPNHVEYNALPWKYAAGTPNILGAVVSAQALRVLLDLALTPKRPAYFGTARPVERDAVRDAMNRVAAWNQALTRRALDGLGGIDGITIYGPRDAARRTSLVAFNLAGWDPVDVARALNEAGIESRAGCHCATLAHHALGLNPPASCRLSFYLYNTPGEVDRAAPDPARAVGDRTARARPGGIVMTVIADPAGFWVSHKNTSVVRRPWCLSCCDDLDRERCDMIPFGR
jgi:hypothetical protein